MKNSEFDKFIKENASSNLSAPNDLDWGDMNIPLPETKSRKKYFLPIFFLVLIASSAIFYSIFSLERKTHGIQKEHTASQVLIEKTTIENSKENTGEPSDTNASVVSEIVTQNEIKTTELREKTNLNEGKNNIKAIRSSDDFHSKLDTPNPLDFIQKTANLSSTSSATSLDTQWIQDEKFNNIVLQRNSDKETRSATQPFATIASLTSFLIINQPSFSTIKLPETTHISLKKESGRRFSNLVFIAGFNQTQNHFSSKNADYLKAIKATDANAWGQSFSLKKVIPLKKSYFATVGFSYNRLHTTFTHNKYLGFTDEPNIGGSFVRNHQTRHLCWNNYQEFAGLNLGIGKAVSLTNRLGLNMELGLAPSYKFKEEGRTLSMNEDILVLEDAAINKFTLAGEASLNFEYKISGLRFLIGGSYSQFLINTVSIENLDLINRPSVLSINVGIKQRF